MRRPYPNYRYSGVEWLGEIPEHWEVKRLKRLASYSTSSVDKKSEDGELPVRLCNYTDVYYRDRVRASGDDFMRATASLSEVERFRLTVGDVVITKDSEDWSDIAVPALVIDTADDFVCGYHLGIIRAGSSVDPAFVFRAMQSVAINRQLQVSASGVTRYGLPNPAVGNTLVPLPPLDEQSAIADFLDRDTAKIDELVAKQQLLLERLAEYRTALITRTVTRGLPPEAARAAGLDPSPRYRPSGVEWLGEVPAHWDVQQMRRIVRLEAGDSITAADIDDLAEFPVFGGNGVRGFTDRYTHEGEFVLIGRQGALCGNVHLARGTFFASEHAVVGTPVGIESVAWLKYMLDAMELNQYSAAAAQPGLAVDRIAELRLPFPPANEQSAIAEFLDKATEHIDALVARVEVAIERLQEYRTALVTAAVTGKIDVRDPAAAMAGSVRA